MWISEEIFFASLLNSDENQIFREKIHQSSHSFGQDRLSLLFSFRKKACADVAFTVDMMFSSTVFLSSIFLLGVSADEAQRREQGMATTMSFIHINDHHSHFDEASMDLSGAKIPPGLSVAAGTLRTYYGTYQVILISATYMDWKMPC
jgi:hypothetical protein